MLKKTWLIWSAILLISGLFPAWAEETNRIDRTTVSGMNIIMQKTNSEMVEMTLLLKSGSGLDPEGKKGTAMVMNSLVWLKLRYSKAKFGMVDVNTFPDFTLITIKTTSAGLNKALEEVKELLTYPLYSYDVITDLKGLFGTDIKGLPVISQSYYELNKEFYGPNHPYNDGLDSAVLATISGRDVYKWYRQTYQPGNAILSISGGVGKNINDIQKVFQKMRSEAIDNRLLVEPVLLERDQILEREDPNGKMTSVCIGFSAPRLQDLEYPAFRVIAYYLEEYQHYFEELRVKDALIYAGFVYYNFMEKPKAPNLVFLTMTDRESLDLVQKRTLSIVDDLINNGIAQPEIDKVVKALKNASAARKVASKGFATKNALSHYLQSQLVYDENLWPKLEQVKTEEIKTVAAKYFQHFIRVAYIPRKVEENL